MTEATVAIFVVIYLGMMLSGLPLVQLDRTGVALLGAIALLGSVMSMSFTYPGIGRSVGDYYRFTAVSRLRLCR